MKKNIKFIVLTIIVLILIAAGTWCINNLENKNHLSYPSPIVQVNYICNNGKTINASFYKGKQKQIEPGQPPILSGNVKLTLSDRRSFDLPQTISADGNRYANSDESFIFWGKGNGALVLENNIEKSYIGCILTAKDPGGLPKIYSDSASGFSIRYPVDYSIDNSYKYQGLEPNNTISGIKFTIPSKFTTGTNLAQDSYISIETMPSIKNCTANIFLSYVNGPEKTISENNIDYSVASSTGAGAGNRYEETVYAIPGTNPCIAIRYFIHYGAIENYLPNIKEFDKQTLLKQFNEIRRALVIR